MSMKSGAILLAVAIVAAVAFTVDEDGSLSRIASDDRDDTTQASGELPVPATEQEWEDGGDWSSSDTDLEASLPGDSEMDADPWSGDGGIEDYSPPVTGGAIRNSNITPPPRPTGELSNPMPPGSETTRFDPTLR